MNWGDFGAAMALVLVFEGLVPFLSPRGYRGMVQQLASMPESTLRGVGLALILAGLLALYLVRA